MQRPRNFNERDVKGSKRKEKYRIYVDEEMKGEKDCWWHGFVVWSNDAGGPIIYWTHWRFKVQSSKYLERVNVLNFKAFQMFFQSCTLVRVWAPHCMKPGVIFSVFLRQHFKVKNDFIILIFTNGIWAIIINARGACFKKNGTNVRVSKRPKRLWQTKFFVFKTIDSVYINMGTGNDLYFCAIAIGSHFVASCRQSEPNGRTFSGKAYNIGK